MSFALVLYYSRYGKTKELANYIATGIESVNLEAKIRTVPAIEPVVTSIPMPGQLADLVAAAAVTASTATTAAAIPATPTIATASAKKPAVPNTGDPYVTLADLADCCALALGSPTRFGNMAAPLKYFIDQTSQIWLSGGMVGKPATVFSSSSSMHGGQETTLLSMMLPLLHHGAIILGTPYTESALASTKTGGTPYGVTHVAGVKNDCEISEDEKSLAIATGKRLAEIAQKLS